jgi:hypothetical protein
MNDAMINIFYCCVRPFLLEVRKLAYSLIITKLSNSILLFLPPILLFLDETHRFSHAAYFQCIEGLSQPISLEVQIDPPPLEWSRKVNVE